jgi:hypothetical protein
VPFGCGQEFECGGDSYCSKCFDPSSDRLDTGFQFPGLAFPTN